MWCISKCIYRGGASRCRHRDSSKYEDYKLGGPPEGDGEQAEVMMERVAATDAQIRHVRQESLWDAFPLTWRQLSDGEEFGPDNLRIRVEPREPNGNDALDASTSGEEEQE